MEPVSTGVVILPPFITGETIEEVQLLPISDAVLQTGIGTSAEVDSGKISEQIFPEEKKKSKAIKGKQPAQRKDAEEDFDEIDEKLRAVDLGKVRAERSSVKQKNYILNELKEIVSMMKKKLLLILKNPEHLYKK